ncbi:type I restriction endonuclease subunit M [Helicobacter bizzozeronii]|uniref:type I restriction endonuclease subunit M n=1 Tax=Helicobacter bizzozeronii TaxID=56877 RepID=UPI001F2E6B60|nr:type I restriction endonuclease subunit M [Helicobacter bizzozeronii]
MQECLEFFNATEQEEEEVKALERYLNANLEGLLRQKGLEILGEGSQAQLIALHHFLEAHKGKEHKKVSQQKQQEFLNAHAKEFQALLSPDHKSFNQPKLKAKCLEFALEALKHTELGAKLIPYYQLSQQEKPLKEKLKKLQEALVALVLDKLKNLSETEILELLGQKWFNPLENALFALPKQFVAQLARRVQALASKYALCLQGVQGHIAQNTQEFKEALSGLEGFSAHVGLQELVKLLKG